MGKKHKGKDKQKPSRREKENRSSNKTVFIVTGVLVLSALAFAFFYQRGNPKPASNITVNPDTLPGTQLSEAPWQPELAHLRERLNIIGLPALAEEGTALHVH